MIGIKLIMKQSMGQSKPRKEEEVVEKQWKGKHEKHESRDNENEKI